MFEIPDMNQSEEIEIMFSDLSEEKQQELLEKFELFDPGEMNWDVLPVAVIPVTKEN